MEYSVSNAAEPLVDDLNSTALAVEFLVEKGFDLCKCFFVGGISRGGIRTLYLGSVLPGIVYSYSAGTILQTNIDKSSPERSPREWESNSYDFVSMVGSSKAIWRLVWGDGDYILKPQADIVRLLNRLKDSLGDRVSVAQVGDGHQIDMPDLLSYAKRFGLVMQQVRRAHLHTQN